MVVRRTTSPWKWKIYSHTHTFGSRRCNVFARKRDGCARAEGGAEFAFSVSFYLRWMGRSSFSVEEARAGRVALGPVLTTYGRGLSVED